MTKKPGKIKAILVDDEERAISFFTELLSEFPEIELVATAQSVDEGLIKILDNRPDIVFLDVQMPEKDGFELLHELEKYEPDPTIIFVTAYDEFAISAIKHAAFDYLLKPVDLAELKKAIARFRNNKWNENKKEAYKNLANSISIKKLRFNSRTGSVFIDPEEIVYVRADGNYSEIYTTDGKKELVTYYISVIEDKINSKFFFRAGRSLIFNLNCLKEIDRKNRACLLATNKGDVCIRVPYKYVRLLEDIL